MKIPIKKIITEGILSNLAEFGSTEHQTPDSSTKHIDRGEKFNNLSPDELMNKATGFKKEQGEMALSKSKRDFLTGQEGGTQMSAADKFKANRNLLLNKG